MHPQVGAGPASRIHRNVGVGIPVAGVLVFVALDVLVFALGSRTTGPAGPAAGLVLRLALDLVALVILRAPVLVTSLLVTTPLRLERAGQARLHQPHATGPAGKGGRAVDPPLEHTLEPYC